MKRVISALALASIAASASAFDLVVQNLQASGIVPVGAFEVSITGFTPANGVIGSLVVDNGTANVTYTYLGKEASFANGFFNFGGSPDTILDTAAVLTSATQTNVGGLLNFNFNTFGTTTVANGSATNIAPTFAIFSGVGTAYNYILAYSDAGAANDRDFDDMVFGVTAVPEPQTYALLLAGLSVVGFVARRRRPQG